MSKIKNKKTRGGYREKKERVRENGMTKIIYIYIYISYSIYVYKKTVYIYS